MKKLIVLLITLAVALPATATSKLEAKSNQLCPVSQIIETGNADDANDLKATLAIIDTSSYSYVNRLAAIRARLSHELAYANSQVQKSNVVNDILNTASFANPETFVKELLEAVLLVDYNANIRTDSDVHYLCNTPRQLQINRAFYAIFKNRDAVVQALLMPGEQAIEVARSN